MDATPRESVGAQVPLLRSLVGGSGSRPVYRFNEYYGQLDCLPQRAGEDALPCFLRGEDSRPSREPIVRNEGPFRERRWGDLCNFVVFDWSGHMVAWSQQLASRLDCELEIPFCAVHLGSAQCTGVLELSVCADVGNLRLLFLFSTNCQSSLR